MCRAPSPRLRRYSRERPRLPRRASAPRFCAAPHTQGTAIGYLAACGVFPGLGHTQGFRAALMRRASRLLASGSLGSGLRGWDFSPYPAALKAREVGTSVPTSHSTRVGTKRDRSPAGPNPHPAAEPTSSQGSASDRTFTVAVIPPNSALSSGQGLKVAARSPTLYSLPPFSGLRPTLSREGGLGR
jgi:hypothetical protein